MYFDDDFSFFFLFGINLFLEYNPILSVISLIMIYINSTLILSILHYEYIAAVLLLIYVGAISILILFIIMMYRINETEMDILYNKWIQTTWFPVLVLPTVCVIGMILDTIILTYSQHIQYMYSTVYNMLNEHVYHIYNNSTLCELSSTSNINTLGDLLFTWYMYPLIIAAFFLFFVVIVCINLILKHSN